MTEKSSQIFPPLITSQITNSILPIKRASVTMRGMTTKKYAADYELITREDETGHTLRQIVYRGSFFQIPLSEAELAHFRKTCFLLLGAILALHISTGFIRSQASFQLYISLPYVFAFFPLLFLAESILRLPQSKPRYRRDEVALSFNRLKTTSFLLLIFLGIGLLGEVIFFLVTPAPGPGWPELFNFSLQALASAAAWSLFRLQKRVRVDECIDS
jgi:hypothetical protein